MQYSICVQYREQRGEEERGGSEKEFGTWTESTSPPLLPLALKCETALWRGREGGSPLLPSSLDSGERLVCADANTDTRHNTESESQLRTWQKTGMNDIKLALLGSEGAGKSGEWRQGFQTSHSSVWGLCSFLKYCRYKNSLLYI